MAVLICFIFFLLTTGEEGMGKLNLLQIYQSVKRKRKTVAEKDESCNSPSLVKIGKEKKKILLFWLC